MNNYRKISPDNICIYLKIDTTLNIFQFGGESLRRNLINICMYLKLSEVTAVDIELTNKCNAACPACNRKFYAPEALNNFEYSLQDIKNIVPVELLRPDVEFFFGGTVDDAMMNSQVVEICDYLLSGGSDIVLETNTGANTAATFTALGEPNKHDRRLTVRFSVDGTEHSNPFIQSKC